MSRPIHTRRATDADLAAVASLVVIRASGTLEAWTQRLKHDLSERNRALWVADCDDDVVAYGRAHYFHKPADGAPRMAPSGFYLIGLYVSEHLRRQGVGRTLTEARLAWIGSRAREAWYFSNARNRASLALHADLGFREVTRDFEYPGVEFDGGVGVLCVKRSGTALARGVLLIQTSGLSRSGSHLDYICDPAPGSCFAPAPARSGSAAGVARSATLQKRAQRIAAKMRAIPANPRMTPTAA